MAFKNNFFSLLVAAAIFLAPINLFIKWGEQQAYVGGIFTDYLVQKFWIGEIPVLLTIVFWCLHNIRGQKPKILPFLKKNIGWLIILSALAVRQFFTPLPTVSMWHFAKLVELLLFARCLVGLWPKIHLGLFRYALLLTIIFQASVATIQFYKQQSLFEYQVLGETQLAGSINIARSIFKTGERILPYGTTAHPNILAGALVIFGILWLQLQTKHRRIIPLKHLAMIAVISWVLFLTQSLSAGLALTFYLLLQSFSLFKKYLFPLAVFLLITTPIALILIPEQFQSESAFRRTFLNAYSVSVAAAQPVFGTGLSLFTTTLKDAEGSSLSQFIRFIQPVHNLPLLWLAETGLLGIALLWLGLKKLRFAKNTEWLLILVPIVSLDHYLLTQWVGGFLLSLLLATQIVRSGRQKP